MMKQPFKFFIITILIFYILVGCGSSRILKIPLVVVDNVPLKASELSENELKSWGYLDLAKDTVPGMSVNRAYDEIIKTKKGKTTIVAVIDSGIDIDHEDLENVIWTNPNEIPNNGKDDDNNGYVDDVHGWNFLGDAYDEQLEYVRLLTKGDTSNPDYERAEKEYEEELQKYTRLHNEYNNYQNQYREYKKNYGQLLEKLNAADEVIAKHLNKREYSKDEVNDITDLSQAMQESVSVMKYIYSTGFNSAADAKKEIEAGLNQINDDLQQLEESLVDINERLNSNLNKDLKGRKTNDDPDDLSDVGYGNNNVKPIAENEEHGTHVAGIIAAERNNNKGINGVANNVKIMTLRVVSNGDEYDKDVALAIRYAADNGAKVVNMSFGKYYSPHSDWVRDAIVYAAKKDVLLVSGAGNESLDLDQKANYPNDQVNNGPEISDNYLTVGALEPKYGLDMVAEYSNYGNINVDVFAPGSDIYSTIPNNNYQSFDGTSMASPAVAGIAALLRSQYPGLTASQVKHIIMDSGLLLTTKVEAGETSNKLIPFNELSKSGKIVNLYNALILASGQISR
ncbi:MAG TPA: S8 family serine peptidase [Flavobacteriaceae bacterium]